MNWADPSPISVIHVDDEPDFADLTATFLERELEHCTVEAALGPSEGMELLTDDVDCIVSDYDMPGRNGLEFLDTVRAVYPDLPFILYTGKGSEEVASRAISAGVTDYLQKRGGTGQYELLANRVKNAVSQYRAERQIKRTFNAIENAHDGISLLDEDGEFLFLNEAYAEIFGYDRPELLGCHWERLYPDEAVPHVQNTLIPQARDGIWKGTNTMLRKDGSLTTVEHTLTYADDDTLVCTVSEPPDEQLKQRLTLRERAMDEAPVGIVLTDPFQQDNPIIYANDRFVELTGYPREEIVGQNCRFLQGPETRAAPVAAMRDAIDAGEPISVTLRNYRKDGTAFWNWVSITPIRDETGTVTNYAGFQADITDHVECDGEHLPAVADTHERLDQLLEQVVAVAQQEGEVPMSSPYSSATRRDASETD